MIFREIKLRTSENAYTLLRKDPRLYMEMVLVQQMVAEDEGFLEMI
jgi:hypothetical protein